MDQRIADHGRELEWIEPESGGGVVTTLCEPCDPQGGDETCQVFHNAKSIGQEAQSGTMSSLRVARCAMAVRWPARYGGYGGVTVCHGMIANDV